jgi:hypothetical protein
VGGVTVIKWMLRRVGRGGGTWEDVGGVQFCSIRQAVDPEGGAIDPVGVALVGSPPVPRHLLVLLLQS